MKEKIHPEYKEATIACACGEVIHTRSTKTNIHVEICSKCHPFFTGKQKLVDSAGRVDKYLKRFEKKKPKVKKKDRQETTDDGRRTTEKKAAIRKKMFDKLEEKLRRFEELEGLVGDPKIIANPAEYKKCAKELASLQKIAAGYNEYKKVAAEILSLEGIAGEKGPDEDFLSLAMEELETLKTRKKALEGKLENLLIEKEDDLDRDIIMEIRQGTGGVEAALFAQDLFRMYSKYAAKKNWKIEVLSTSLTEKGGFKEIIFSVSGNGVYGKFRYESGTHRVQRVPVTEASGRIHTSAATVAVLAEADDVEVDIKPQDLKIDVFRAGGRGGQHVNVTDSAVRITHLPTGLVVSCQDERSQHKNKTKAMRVLKARLLDKMKAEQHKKISQDRKLQVGTGDRSEKIRTYNFPDRRITDHRINFTVHDLEKVLNGDLDKLIEALSEADRKTRIGKGVL